jgi:hypothetical protein
MSSYHDQRNLRSFIPASAHLMMTIVIRLTVVLFYPGETFKQAVLGSESAVPANLLLCEHRIFTFLILLYSIVLYVMITILRLYRVSQGLNR